MREPHSGYHFLLHVCAVERTSGQPETRGYSLQAHRVRRANAPTTESEISNDRIIFI
ncbi:hypothetical protein [Paraburkholderia fungorum]|jgi:hypothetical protein|uniref:Uncharacterized protein n=1 Tax=Paraburkholderia fungorum TaxID=134537 RepID=A0AAP5QEN9_9BURK|nr:hypothetical protein [Paraburkholderia fungorum]MBB4515000.1 hypothetical protein [Paraburkholderia fungorum]MBB5544693.1 hypothetical protein [Paraburkholderia fungorum]MBU7442205.1 hypothetical protein [Paraburkholderia fungorum]MDT8841145.1 hypothetical protein [Paraburkholderia fungorum]